MKKLLYTDLVMGIFFSLCFPFESIRFFLFIFPGKCKHNYVVIIKRSKLLLLTFFPLLTVSCKLKSRHILVSGIMKCTLPFLSNSHTFHICWITLSTKCFWQYCAKYVTRWNMSHHSFHICSYPTYLFGKISRKMK